MEVPPYETKGRGCPVVGKSLTATAILIMAWKTRRIPSPIASNPPKCLGHRVDILIVLKRRMR